MSATQSCSRCQYFDKGDSGRSGRCKFPVEGITLPSCAGLPMPIKLHHVTPRSGRTCQCFDPDPIQLQKMKAIKKLTQQERDLLGLRL